MLLLLLLLQGCLLSPCPVSAGLSSPLREGHQLTGVRRVKRSDDVSLVSLQTLVQQQASVIDRLQAEMTALKNRVDSMQPKVDSASKSVAFTARLSRSQDNGGHGMALGFHQTVVFDDVVANIGSGYNHHNGIFTAPVTGSYVFFLQMMSTNNQDPMDLAIVHNGNILDLVFAEGSGDSYDQGSSTVTAHLRAGDEVWVRQHSGNAVRADYWTIFTGFLLQAD